MAKDSKERVEILDGEGLIGQAVGDHLHLEEEMKAVYFLRKSNLVAYQK